MPLGDDFGMIAFCDLIGCQSRGLGSCIEPPGDPGLQRLEIIVEFRTLIQLLNFSDQPVT